MQGGQCATADQRCDETTKAQREIGACQFLLGLLLSIQHPADIEHHDCKQVGGAAEEIKQYVGYQRTEATNTISDLPGCARLAEAWVSRIVGKERIPEN